MLFRPDRVLRMKDNFAPAAAGDAGGAPAPSPQAPPVEEGAARQRPTGGATLDRGDTLKVEKKVGAEWAHTQGYLSKFREAAAAVAKAEIDAKIKKAKAEQNLQNAGQLDEFAAGLQQLENEALQSSLQNAHNIQQLGREVGSFRPRPGRIFQDSSGAAMWGAAMSLAASSFQSERSGGPNTALEIINTAIKQDLAAQEIQYDAMKTELQANQTLYSQMRASYGDAIAARTAQSAVLREAAAARLQAAGNQFLPAQARAQAAIAQEKLIQQANADLVKAAEMTFTRTSKRAAAGAGEALINLLPAELQQKLVNASGGADLRLLAQFGVDGAEFYRQQAGRLKEESDAEEAQGKAGEAVLLGEGEKLDRAVAAERARTRPTRPTQRGAVDATAPVAPAEEVVATEQVTEEALPGGGEEVQERADVTVESAAAADTEAAQALEANRSQTAELATRYRDLQDEIARLEAIREPQGASERAQEISALEAEAEGVRAAYRQSLEAGVGLQGAADRGRQQSEAAQRARDQEARQKQEAAADAAWRERRQAGSDEVRGELGTFFTEGFGAGSDTVGAKIRAGRSAASGLVEDLQAGGERRADVRSAVDATLPEGAWIGSVQRALSKDVSKDEAQSAMANVGYALEFFGGASNESDALRRARVMNASEATAQRGKAKIPVDARALSRVQKYVRMGDVSVAYRLRPEDFSSFTKEQMNAQVQAIEKSLAGGGVRGMPMRLGTRPLTVNVTPQQYTDEGWRDVPGADKVEVTYNVPVALASKFFPGDVSGGEPFVGGRDALVGDTIDDPVGATKRRLVGSAAEKKETRERLGKVGQLREFAGAMQLYGELFALRDQSAFSEAAEGGLTGVTGPELKKAWDAARARGGFGRLGEVPAKLDEATGRWRMNPNSNAAVALGITQDGDKFSVTPGTSDIYVGPLSHFVGFMAPQRAEMQLLKKGTSGETPPMWNLIQQWRRGGAQNPQGAAYAFGQFLKSSAEALVQHNTVPAANAAMIYDGAIKALSGEQSQGIRLNELLQAKRRSGRRR